MSDFVTKTLNQFKVLVLCGLVVLFTQTMTQIRSGGDMLDPVTATVGMLSIIVICMLALKIKEVLPLQIPAFAWASLFSLLLTTPWSPVATPLLAITSGIGTLQVGTVILAAAGISIGTKLDDIKKLSWKIILVAVIVFMGTFFGSALVSHCILSAQGII